MFSQLAVLNLTQEMAGLESQKWSSKVEIGGTVHI